MKQQSKHIPLEQEQARAAELQTQSQSGREFASVEDMLRYDAAQTIVPATIAARLQQQTGALPPPARSWWRRVLGW